MEENQYAKYYSRPSGSRTMNVLEDLSVMEELQTLSMLPTIREVCRGFEWRFNELKNSGANPRFIDVTEKIEPDLRKTWEKASLSNVFLTSQRFKIVLKNLRDRIAALKAQPKNKLESPTYLAKLDQLKIDSQKLFDVCTCKCKFNFDENIAIEDIPCSNKWRSKIMCGCSLDKRVHPLEL